MPFSDMQQEYFYKATHRWDVKSGATRSGKTYMDYYLIPKRLRAVSGKEGLNVILGNTRGTLQRNIIEPLQRIWGINLVSDIHSDNTAAMFGEKVYCLGADKANQVDRIRGSSIKYCYGDEVVTWHEDVFTMLKSRLDKPYSRFDGTCNPDNPSHWFKAFIDSDVDIYLQEYTIDDNPFLSSEFVENLKKEYAGTVFYDRYILGQWTLAKGLVYQNFSEDEHVVDNVPENGAYYVSMDYGTLNPCSMGLWCISGGVAYRIKEYYHDGRKTGRQLTDEEYYQALERLTQGLKIQYIVVDPSAASFKATIRRHGRFSVRDAKNDVINGILQTARLLQQGKIKIHCSCRDCIREFKTYRFDEDALIDRVIKENDHAMDDMRYFCNTILTRIWR